MRETGTARFCPATLTAPQLPVPAVTPQLTLAAVKVTPGGKVSVTGTAVTALGLAKLLVLALVTSIVKVIGPGNITGFGVLWLLSICKSADLTIILFGKSMGATKDVQVSIPVSSPNPLF